MEINRVVSFTRRHGVPSFAFRNPALGLGVLGMPVVGLGAGVAQARYDRDNYPDMPFSDRAANAGLSASGAAAGSLILGGVGHVAWRNRSTVVAGSKKLGAWFGNRVVGAINDAEYARNAFLAAGSSSVPSALRAYGGSARLMVGGGAAIGAAIGGYYGDPVSGAVIGAGAGAAVKVGLGFNRYWNAASKIPGARTATVLALSTLLYHGVQAMSGPTVSGEAFGTPDGSGGYEYSAQPTVKDRMRKMGASGDMVFGLNSQRHS